MTKMGPGADQGRLILHFGAVLGRVEKSLIFDVAPGRPKINKNRSVGVLGAPRAQRNLAKESLFEARGP